MKNSFANHFRNMEMFILSIFIFICNAIGQIRNEKWFAVKFSLSNGMEWNDGDACIGRRFVSRLLRLQNSNNELKRWATNRMNYCVESQSNTQLTSVFWQFQWNWRYFALINAIYPVIIHIHISRRQQNQNPAAAIVLVKVVELNTYMKKLYMYIDGNDDDDGNGDDGDDDDGEEEEKNRKRRRSRRKKVVQHHRRRHLQSF